PEERERAAELRHGLVDDIHLLRRGIPETGKPGDVPARAGQTLDEAFRDRVGDVQHDHRDLGDDRVDGPDLLVLERYNEIHTIPDKRLGRGPRGIFVDEVAPVEVDV